MSVIKRRHFLQTSLAALPAAALPFGKLMAAVDVAAGSDIEAVTGDGKQVLLKAADVRDFAASLRGDLLMRDSAGYDAATCAAYAAIAELANHWKPELRSGNTSLEELAEDIDAVLLLLLQFKQAVRS